MAGNDAILHHVIALESRLLDPSTRREPSEVTSLLHPDFREIGASGRWWNRDEIVAALAAEPGERRVAQDVVARYAGDSAVLVTYTTHDSLRSSLWVRCPEGWRVLFHQGTPIA
jgi:ribonuclease HI